MKELLKLMSVIFLTLGFLVSCETLDIEEISEEASALKSASFEKQSYIVVLNDVELNSELSAVKDYGEKKAKVKSASAKILKRAGISDGDIGYTYGVALKGFSVKLPPGQLKKLEADPSVVYVEKDQRLHPTNQHHTAFHG